MLLDLSSNFLNFSLGYFLTVVGRFSHTTLGFILTASFILALGFMAIIAITYFCEELLKKILNLSFCL